jgi:hypothetical protein
MRIWIGVGTCVVILILYGVLHSFAFEATPLWRIGSGLTTMLAPFALIGLLAILYQWAKSEAQEKKP